MLKSPLIKPLKALLKSKQSEPRNYASVLGVYPSKQSFVWTDGFSLVKYGEPAGKPEELVTLKDLELRDVSGGQPWEVHELATRPAVRYPSFDGIKHSKVSQSIQVNTKLLLDTVDLIRKLSLTKEIKLSITKDGMILVDAIGCNAMIAGKIEEDA